MMPLPPPPESWDYRWASCHFWDRCSFSEPGFPQKSSSGYNWMSSFEERDWILQGLGQRAGIPGCVSSWPWVLQFLTASPPPLQSSKKMELSEEPESTVESCEHAHWTSLLCYSCAAAASLPTTWAWVETSCSHSCWLFSQSLALRDSHLRLCCLFVLESCPPCLPWIGLV